MIVTRTHLVMSISFASFRRVRLNSAAVLLMAAFTACSTGADSTTPSNPATETYASSLSVRIADMQKKSDNLYYQDVVVGTGTEAIAGRTISVTYTGWTADGTQFDSNVGKTPFQVVGLGTANVIVGWNLGLQGMKVGGKRRLVIGSALGYGESGNGSIGRNKTLVFDVTLLGVQ